MSADTANVPDFQEEGMHTLAAQVSRKAADRITAVIKRERARGATRQALVKALAKNLADYDEHTRELLMKMGFEEPIPDDFPDSIVKATEQVKANTIVLTLTEIPAGLTLFTLTQHKNQQWLIVDKKDTTVTLKMLK
ncbi:MAG TPA: hypothetical protein VEJ63_20220 [Planctomycetota bacterium]|nr:hypothetical protein [Planctomycetota bacterium]